MHLSDSYYLLCSSYSIFISVFTHLRLLLLSVRPCHHLCIIIYLSSVNRVSKTRKSLCLMVNNKSSGSSTTTAALFIVSVSAVSLLFQLIASWSFKNSSTNLVHSGPLLIWLCLLGNRRNRTPVFSFTSPST